MGNRESNTPEVPDQFDISPIELREGLIENGYVELPITGTHALSDRQACRTLHKDPFDRILIAQAMVEGITLLTADPVVARYPGPIRKV